MELFLIGVGGAAGSLVRYKLGKIISQKHDSSLPIGTFVINMSGAILLGFVTGFNPGTNSSLLLADGFLGAYTTFSTFMYEGFHLFQDNEKKNAFIYILFSLIFGIVGYLIGFEISRMVKMF